MKREYDFRNGLARRKDRDEAGGSIAALRRLSKPGQGMIGLLSDEEKTRILLTRIGEERKMERGPPAPTDTI